MQDYNVFKGIEDVSDLKKCSVMNKMVIIGKLIS